MGNALEGIPTSALESGAVGRLVEAAKELLGDQDECYEPGMARVTLAAVDKIRAALAQPPGDERRG